MAAAWRGGGGVAAAPGRLLAMTRRELLSVALVATVVRLVAFTQHLASPLVEHPALDARYYDLAARSLVEGELAPGLGTGFRSLLYPRILAAVYTLAGDWGRLAALLLQHAAGVATALVVAALAFRVWGRRSAALAAGLLYALGAPPVFFEGELLVESWFVAVVAAQLLAFALVDDRREPGDARVALAWALLAGALAAVGVRLRPNHLLFVAALPLLLLPRAARSARRPAVLAALGGALATLVALALWELPSIGRFQLVPSAGGVNLYLGNKRAADGMIPRQDWGVTYAEEYRDSVEVFAEEAFRSDRGLAPGDAIDPGALSRYWLGRAASEIAADPWGRLALLGRKCLLLLWNVEIPNHRSFDFVAREEIPLLARLPVRFGLLFALALAGLAVRRGAGPPRPAGPRASDAALGPAALLLFTGVHAAGVVLFFVNDRYRLPLWPALAALAGGGASALVASARERRWRELAPPLGAACLGALLCFPNWTGTRLPGPGRDLLYRSIAWSDRGSLGPGALRRRARRGARAAPGGALASVGRRLRRRRGSRPRRRRL